MIQTDVLVLGGGPGGYPAAFAAADHDMNVFLVDEGVKPGGVCLHRDCIPSKSLLHAAGLINESKESVEWGIRFAPPEIDLERLREWKEGIIGRLTDGFEGLCKARGVRLIKARGRFTSSTILETTASDGAQETIEF